MAFSTAEVGLKIKGEDLNRLRILAEQLVEKLRDVDGTPITPQQARAIIAERYTVPDEVRQRNNRRTRRERAERRAERKFKKRSRPTK